MISVIIPVLNNKNFTENLLKDILNNVEKPKEILIIDDGSSEDIRSLLVNFKELNIKYIRHQANRGVNYSWNEGIKYSTGNYISVLNNDLILNKYFFKKIKEVFIKDDTIGIVCPTTIINKEKVLESEDKNIILESMKKREGWAFTIRKSLTKRIDPIPSLLRTYCGDDYLFYCARRLTYKCLKISNNYIYHYRSLTVNKTKECFGEREREKIIWNEIKQRIK